MQRRVSIKQSEAFAYPLLLVGEVAPRRDFEKSTRDHPVQEVDKETGVRMWDAEVVDTDPEARKSERSFTVKMVSERQPVPPAAVEGSTMRPVVFNHLEASPYVDARSCTGVDQPHRCRAKVAWSYRASGFADGGTVNEAADTVDTGGTPTSTSKSSGSSRSAA